MAREDDYDDDTMTPYLRKLHEVCLREAMAAVRRLLTDPSVTPDVAVRAARLVVDLENTRQRYA
jgi:hypothetical protein